MCSKSVKPHHHHLHNSTTSKSIKAQSPVQRHGYSAPDARSFCSGEDEYKYQMKYHKVGRCLIINNKEFFPSLEMETRIGTDVDAEALTKLFTSLKYEVTKHKNLTVEKMKEVLETESFRDHTSEASFVCVIMTHGEEGVVYGTDGCVRFHELTHYFKGNRCRSLIAKPKLFFIQACRGKKVDEGVGGTAHDGTEDSTLQRIPVEADFLYAYATAPGYYSWRDSDSGSWFIQSLCETIPKYKHLELMHILTRVNRRVAYYYESANTDTKFNRKKEIPCTVSLLTKEFYFP